MNDPIWEKIGNDGKFRLPGTVIIGDTLNPRQFRYVDGNQATGYVLTSDAFGNASWQPNNGGGGGGGTSCSFVSIEDFTANVTLTVIHNLGTDNIHIQLVRTDTNELIDGYIDNYQLNSVDITLSQTINNVKVIILTGCSSGIEILDENAVVESTATSINFVGSGVKATSIGPDQVEVEVPVGLKNYIRPSDLITVKADYQYFIYGNLTVEGVIDNYGEVVIANGALVILPGGQFNNIGAGLLKVVNLATGISMQVIVRTFSTLPLTPITITHGLGTREFTFNVREGNTLIDVDYTHIDDNSISLTTTAGVTNAVMVFHAKI